MVRDPATACSPTRHVGMQQVQLVGMFLDLKRQHVQSYDLESHLGVSFVRLPIFVSFGTTHQEENLPFERGSDSYQRSHPFGSIEEWGCKCSGCKCAASSGASQLARELRGTFRGRRKAPTRQAEGDMGPTNFYQTRGRCLLDVTEKCKPEDGLVLNVTGGAPRTRI